MKRLPLTWTALALPLLAIGCQPASGPDPESDAPAATLENEEQRTYYAFGAMMASNLGGLTPPQLEAFQAGIADAVRSAPPKVDLTEYGPKVQQMLTARAQSQLTDRHAKAEAFLAEAALEEGAVRTESGLVHKTLTPGDGPQPGEGHVVRVHYRGTLIDGTEFDSSYARNEPAEFPLNRVIPCWGEGVKRMHVGERAKLVCPPDMAYGDNGSPPKIPGGSALVFEVELLATQPG